ncbi:MAG: hypothetical protein K0S39_2297 [Paenibacillus sp.]|jgi:hypothetical protein|nr:hypothetical protein [Paenibacillus sp.]
MSLEHFHKNKVSKMQSDSGGVMICAFKFNEYYALPYC